MRLQINCLVIIVLLVNSIDLTLSANILAVVPLPSKSHWIFSRPLLLELVKSGHNVTIISPYPVKDPPKNYHDVGMPELDDMFIKIVEGFLEKTEDSFAKKMYESVALSMDLLTQVLHHSNVVQLMNSDSKFDVIYIDTIMNDVFLGFAQFYNAPVIAVSPFGPIKQLYETIGSPQPLSYVPNSFSELTHKMNFMQRFENAAQWIIEEIVNGILLRHQNKLYNEVFPDPKPSLQYLRKNAVSLGLLNSHFSLSFPQPYLPNMIEVGGMHINTKPNPLPEDLKKFIESAKHGVVYFSMGSNLKPSKIPKDKLNGIYAALKKLKQKVLWKWDEPEFFGKSDQILVSKWFPQDDILAHKNVRLFITHGGLLSCTEAIYHGIPLIGIPIFGDQLLNMARVVSSGWGLQVMYNNVTEESLSWALTEILSKPQYQKTASEISSRFRDQPMTPLETAKYWVEYVIRHKGAPHLHSSAQDLSFVEYHMIDVWLTMLAIAFVASFILIATIRCILNKVFGETSDEKKSKKNKQVNKKLN